MIKTCTFLISIFITSVLVAQPPAVPANRGMVFGQKTDTLGVISVSELVTKLTEAESAVKVKGRVLEVCTKEGCWLKLETPDGKMMVKMKDHSFLVPLAINGKEIIVDGVAVVKVTPVAELRHYAEDAGKSKEEITAINQPKKEIVLNASGILVL